MTWWRGRSPVAAVEQIRTVADGLHTRNCRLRPARALLDRLESELVPHERARTAPRARLTRGSHRHTGRAARRGSTPGRTLE